MAENGPGCVFSMVEHEARASQVLPCAFETGEVLAYDPEHGQYAPIEGKLVPVVEGTRKGREPKNALAAGP
jgi:predicted Ser/Thr protein kinase